MKIYTKTLAALASGVVLMASVPAHASDGVVFDPVSNTVTFHCSGLDTDGLRDALAYVDFANDKYDADGNLIPGKDRLGLEGKLDMADAKEGEGKLCDAAQKVEDFGSKVAELQLRSSPEKPKISDQYGDQAIECLKTGASDLAEDLLARGQPCDSAGGPPSDKPKGPNK